MNVKSYKKNLISGVIVSLILLPSCKMLDMFTGGSKNDASSVSSSSDNTIENKEVPMTGSAIVTMNGKPIITTDILEYEKENIFKSNPQIKAAVAFMDPKELDRNLIEGLVSQAIMDEYISESKINMSADYQSDLAEGIKAVKRMLNAKFFSQQFPIVVTDSEASKFYETNKESIPGLLMSQGGTLASGIQFNTESDAKDFIAKAKLGNNNFARTAQQEGLAEKIKDFKVVNGQSVGIDPVLRDKIIAIKSVPSIELVSANGSTWVINSISKEAPKYRPFDQVKEAIKQELEKNKRGEQFELEINKLKDTYNVVIDEEYFKSNEKNEESIKDAAENQELAKTTKTNKDNAKEKEASPSKRFA